MPGFISPFIIPGPDGKPVFIGKDQPNPVQPQKKGAQIQCPVCNGMFDYLVGEDTPDEGRRGCESCWRPPKNNHGQGQDAPGADEA